MKPEERASLFEERDQAAKARNKGQGIGHKQIVIHCKKAGNKDKKGRAKQ